MESEQTPIKPHRADAKHMLLILLMLAAVVLSSVNLAVSLSVSKSPQQDAQMNQEPIESADNFHDLAYTFTTPNGFTWIVRPVDSLDAQNSQFEHELVRIDAEGSETRMESFRFVPYLGDISLGIDNAGIVEFKYAMSPGEGASTITEILFSAEGKELSRATYRDSSDSVKFKGHDTHEYTASLAISGTCPNETTVRNGTTLIPGTVELLGIKVISSAGEQMFDLGEPQTVDCATAYGDNIVNPAINIINVMNGTIAFSLPTGERGWVAYDAEGVNVNFY